MEGPIGFLNLTIFYDGEYIWCKVHVHDVDMLFTQCQISHDPMFNLAPT